MNATQFYSTLESLMQSALEKGLEDFRRSKFLDYCREYHDFLWADEEYTHVHRKRLPHAPYEFAARFVGIPMMNLLLQMGLHTNAWFPGYYDIEDEYTNGRQPPRHPSGRVSQMVLFAKSDAGLEKICMLTITFQILHTDLDGAFGFKVPEVAIVESYCDEPEKYVHLINSDDPVEDYHLLGESWVI